MDEFVTFGLLMGLDPQDTSAGDGNKNALLIFCPTGESEVGKIDVTRRMIDLALMCFQPVAISRWKQKGTGDYVILAKENLPEALKTAVLKDAGNIVRKAIEDFEL